ncbi:MAG: 6-carboxytetrahydropterin synthase [Vicinamibacterales bacterium]
MYTVSVRDHLMIAHSFRGAVFGPAQKLHGATYVVDLELSRAELDEDGIVVDIGLATELLKEVVGSLSFRNLDEDLRFANRNSTTEVVARTIFDAVKHAVAEGRLGKNARGITKARVVLHESHVAWAAYEGALH